MEELYRYSIAELAEMCGCRRNSIGRYYNEGTLVCESRVKEGRRIYYHLTEKQIVSLLRSSKAYRRKENELSECAFTTTDQREARCVNYSKRLDTNAGRNTEFYCRYCERKKITNSLAPVC